MKPIQIQREQIILLEKKLSDMSKKINELEWRIENPPQYKKGDQVVVVESKKHGIIHTFDVFRNWNPFAEIEGLGGTVKIQKFCRTYKVIVGADILSVDENEIKSYENKNNT